MKVTLLNKKYIRVGCVVFICCMAYDSINAHNVFVIYSNPLNTENKLPIIWSIFVSTITFLIKNNFLLQFFFLYLNFHFPYTQNLCASYDWGKESNLTLTHSSNGQVGIKESEWDMNCIWSLMLFILGQK